MSDEIQKEMNPIWNADIPIDDAQVIRLLEMQFPNLQPVAVKMIAEGWDNYVYEVNRTYIFRFPRRQIAVPLIEFEIKILPYLSQHLYKSVPAMTHTGKPTVEYPYPFMGYEKIPGSTLYLSQDTDAQDTDVDLNPLAFELGTFLRHLHSIPLKHTECLQLPMDTINRMNPVYRREKWQPLSADLKAANIQLDVDALSVLFYESIEIGFQEEATHTIVHGDLYPLQMLVDEHDHLTGVIDWGDCHIGDPAVDLAVLHCALPYSTHASFVSAYGFISESAWHRARFRAIYHSAIIVLYGLSIQNHQITDSGLFGLHNMIQKG